MNILHTADWHLGAQLCQRKREPEHQAFLNRLLTIIAAERVELLLVAGDVFDSAVPPNYALELFFSFLARCRAAGCRKVIITSGNHDSPATLRAPQELLAALDVHVIASADITDPARHLIPVTDGAGAVQAIVCAAPFLREREVYTPAAGEDFTASAAGIVTGTAAFFRALAEAGGTMRASLGQPPVPLLAVGHLFARGGLIGGTEREMYVGNLGLFPGELFPKEFSYVALGHLHRPQTITAATTVQYAGSPLPLSFAEAAYEHRVVLVDTACPESPKSIPIPRARRLVRLSGDLDELAVALTAVEPAADELEPWVEATYTGPHLLPDLREQVEALAADLPLTVMQTRNASSALTAASSAPPVDLQQITPEEVFARLLAERNVAAEDVEPLQRSFSELLLRVRSEEAA